MRFLTKTMEGAKDDTIGLLKVGRTAYDCCRIPQQSELFAEIERLVHSINTVIKDDFDDPNVCEQGHDF